MSGDMWDLLHTAEDLAAMRRVAYQYRADTGNVDGAQWMLDVIRERAVELGLETP